MVEVRSPKFKGWVDIEWDNKSVLEALFITDETRRQKPKSRDCITLQKVGRLGSSIKIGVNARIHFSKCAKTMSYNWRSRRPCAIILSKIPNASVANFQMHERRARRLPQIDGQEGLLLLQLNLDHMARYWYPDIEWRSYQSKNGWMSGKLDPSAEWQLGLVLYSIASAMTP